MKKQKDICFYFSFKLILGKGMFVCVQSTWGKIQIHFLLPDLVLFLFVFFSITLEPTYFESNYLFTICFKESPWIHHMEIQIGYLLIWKWMWWPLSYTASWQVTYTVGLQILDPNPRPNTVTRCKHACKFSFTAITEQIVSQCECRSFYNITVVMIKGPK